MSKKFIANVRDEVAKTLRELKKQLEEAKGSKSYEEISIQSLVENILDELSDEKNEARPAEVGVYDADNPQPEQPETSDEPYLWPEESEEDVNDAFRKLFNKGEKAETKTKEITDEDIIKALSNKKFVKKLIDRITNDKQASEKFKKAMDFTKAEFEKIYTKIEKSPEDKEASEAEAAKGESEATSMNKKAYQDYVVYKNSVIRRITAFQKQTALNHESIVQEAIKENMKRELAAKNKLVDEKVSKLNELTQRAKEERKDRNILRKKLQKELNLNPDDNELQERLDALKKEIGKADEDFLRIAKELEAESRDEIKQIDKTLDMLGKLEMESRDVVERIEKGEATKEDWQRSGVIQEDDQQKTNVPDPSQVFKKPITQRIREAYEGKTIEEQREIIHAERSLREQQINYHVMQALMDGKKTATLYSFDGKKEISVDVIEYMRVVDLRDRLIHYGLVGKGNGQIPQEALSLIKPPIPIYDRPAVGREWSKTEYEIDANGNYKRDKKGRLIPALDKNGKVVQTPQEPIWPFKAMNEKGELEKFGFQQVITFMCEDTKKYYPFISQTMSPEEVDNLKVMYNLREGAIPKIPGRRREIDAYAISKSEAEKAAFIKSQDKDEKKKHSAWTYAKKGFNTAKAVKNTAKNVGKTIMDIQSSALG